MREAGSIDEFDDDGSGWRRRVIALFLVGIVATVETVGTPHLRLDRGYSEGRYAGVEGIRYVRQNSYGVTPLFVFVPLQTPLRDRAADAVSWAWREAAGYAAAGDRGSR